MYYSSKYSPTMNYEDGRNFTPELPESIQNNKYMYLNMTLTPDTHFHNIEVDTSHSSVHVPTNVYDKCKFTNDSHYMTSMFGILYYK